MNKLLAVVASSLLTVGLNGQQIVNLDATVNGVGTPISINVPAGCYSITPIGPSAGGTYTSWHPWGGVNVGCAPSGLGCTQGWTTLFYVWTPGTAGQYGGYGFSATSGQALANSTTSTYWVPQAGNLNFIVADQAAALPGNLGGLSLRVDPIIGCSNAASIATYGAGSAGAAGVPMLAGNGMPQLGNTAFALDLSQCANDSLMVWAVGSNQANVPLPGYGASLLIQPVLFTLADLTDATGEGSLDIPLECDPVLCAQRFTLQAVVLDASAQGGLAFSNGVDLTVGS